MGNFVFSASAFLLGIALIGAGIGKLAQTPYPEQLAALRLPDRLRTTAAIRVHAVVEMVLGVAVVIAPGWARAVVGVLALLLTVGYLVVAWRAWRAPEPLACHCFGRDDDRPVGPLHLVLNLALIALAVTTVVAGLRGWSVIDDLHPAVAGVLGVLGFVWAFFVYGRGESHRPRGPYLRRPIPAGQVVIGGRTYELSDLAKERAQLLLRVPRLGKDREHLLAAVPEWQPRLPHVDIRVVDSASGATWRRLGIVGAPSAVVLGADGLLAGGPVAGADRIRELVAELTRMRTTPHP